MVQWGGKDSPHAEELALLQEVLSSRQRGWEFQADHEEEHEDLNLPLFPSTKMNIPKTLTEEKNLAELLFDDQEESSGPYAWIEHTWAQTVVAAVIVLNAVLFGWDSDMRSGLWAPIEHVILIIFGAEQAIRMARYGLSYFSSLGNLFDLFIVLCGATDLWVMPLISVLSGQKSSKSSILQVMQLLRLLRIARLIRIVKIIPPLYSLAVGIGEALQGMFWVLIFLFMLLYACAILTARCLGMSEGEMSDEGSKAEEVRVMFDGVMPSMFVLFESITCWSLMGFTPLFRMSPGSRFVAVIFYIFANWGLLAVMTGVVSEKMMATKERLTAETDDGPQKHDPSSSHMAQLEGVLMDFFRRADTDGSGEVSKDEFNNMLMCTDIMKTVMEESSIDAQDLGELFEWLDGDKDGLVNIEEFLRGFRWLVATVDPKGLLKLEEELAGDFHRLTRRMVLHVNNCFDQLLESVSVPLKKISAITEQIQRMDRLIGSLQKSPDEMDGKAGWSSLDLTERRLAVRLDTLAKAVEKLAELEAQGLVKLSEDAQLEVDLDIDITNSQLIQSRSLPMFRANATDRASSMAEEDDSRQEDLIFFEPAMETLSDMANDDDELPKGISKAKREPFPNIGPGPRRSGWQV